jgi:hypothetical protein
MSFNGIMVWRVRVWLFAIGVLLVAAHRPFAAEPAQVVRAECPAVMTTAVRRLFALAPPAPGPMACAPRRSQHAVLSRLVQES